MPGLVLALWVRARDTVGVRGTVDDQMAMLSTLSTEDLIAEDHPIRRIRTATPWQKAPANPTVTLGKFVYRA